MRIQNSLQGNPGAILRIFLLFYEFWGLTMALKGGEEISLPGVFFAEKLDILSGQLEIVKLILL